jgi:hypothetical protein
MALPKRKPSADTVTKPAPQFRVVGKDEPAKTGGLNFGGIAKPTAKKTTPSHPTLTLTGEGLELLGQYAEKAPQFKELEKLVGSKGSIKAQLRPHIIEAYFRLFAGRAIDDSRCLTTATVGEADSFPIKLTFKEQYSKLCTNLATLVGAVPKAEPHVHVVNTLKIEFDKIATEKQQPLVDAIIAAAQELEISEGITASECVQPKPGFHAQRCIILSPEENVAFDEIIPITAYPQL